jgi:hypothetical protein
MLGNSISGNKGRKAKGGMMDRIWLQIGETGEYEDCDTPYDAGMRLGMCLDPEGSGDVVAQVNRRRLGVTVYPFGGYNYVSLYWGDDDAQPVDRAELSDSEFEEFLAGIEEEGVELIEAEEA